jgi:hypothetical protein
MMSLRSPDLLQFLNLADTAIRRGSAATGTVRQVTERMFMALQTPAAQAAPSRTERLPVCRHLASALKHARCQPGPVSALADAFAVIEPQLCWRVRAGADSHGERFVNSHANATIIGPEGLELRSDVWIGVSLLGPHTRYPDHHHPPEEVYVALSDGEWCQESGPWHAPGIGGLVHNPPNIVHAMRSAESPLLALWFLWTEPNHS